MMGVTANFPSSSHRPTCIDTYTIYTFHVDSTNPPRDFFWLLTVYYWEGHLRGVVESPYYIITISLLLVTLRIWVRAKPFFQTPGTTWLAENWYLILNHANLLWFLDMYNTWFVLALANISFLALTPYLNSFPFSRQSGALKPPVWHGFVIRHLKNLMIERTNFKVK